MSDVPNASPSGPQAALVAFAVRFRGIVLALSLALAGYGIYVLGDAKYDVFPEFAPPSVVVQTEAPGLNPEQVEVLVTQPIEVAVNGLPGIESPAVELDPGPVGHHRHLRYRQRRLPRPPARHRAADGARRPSAAGRAAPGDDRTHLGHQQPCSSSA